MSFYTLALFAHLLGVLGLYGGLSLGWGGILRLRRAQTVAQVRERTSLTRVQGRFFPIAGLLILVTGIYMTVTAWDSDPPWILLSLAALIVMGVLGGAVGGRRLSAIERAAAEAADGMIPPALQRRIADPVLLTALQTTGMIGLGVVFLMAAKPDLPGSLITLGVAIVLGVLSAQFWPRPREAQAQVAEARPGSSRSASL